MNFEKEIKKDVFHPYTSRRKLLDLKILEKVYHINRKYLFISLAVLIFLIFNRRFFLFVFLTGISAVFSLYHAKYNRSPMDFKWALFLGLFITRYYGLHFTLIFFIISDLVPSLLGGESIDGASLVFITWYFIVNTLVYLFPLTWSMTLVGPILVSIEALGSFFINSRFGIPGLMSFMVSILTILVRIIYFVTLGGVLEALFRIFL
jgi:hypothetical protein